MNKLLPALIIFFVSLSAKAQKIEPPHFRGGQPAFHEFLDKNLKVLPDTGASKTHVGIVLLGFNVEADGKLSDIRIIKHLNTYYDAEALRVIRLSPRWVPAIRSGVFIKSKYTVPLQFILSE